MLLTIGIILGALPILFYVIIKLYEYFKRSQIRHEKTGEVMPGTSIFNQFLFKKNKKMMEIMMKNIQKFGPIYSSFLGPYLQVVVASPELAKRVLMDTSTFSKFTLKLSRIFSKFFGRQNVVSANGEEWKRQRKPMDPAFYNISIFVDTFVEKARIALEIFQKMQIVNDVQDTMQKMTLDVLGNAIFGHDFNSLRGSLQEELQTYNFVVTNLLPLRFWEILLPFNILPTKSYRQLNTAIDNLNNFFLKLINKSKEKIKNKKQANTLLDFMVQYNQEHGMTDEELRSNVLVFFLAGHETTSVALSFATYVLARNRDIQQKVREEVDRIIGNSPITYEKMQKMDYLSLFIKEVMRMYPPTGFIAGRLITKNVSLGGYKIPKGTLASVSIYGIHHSKEIYGDPETFRPERWLKDDIPGLAWLPFSAGPRVCIGKNFSLMEQKVFLSMLLQKFELSILGNQDVKIDSSRMILLQPEKMDVKFTLRNKN